MVKEVELRYQLKVNRDQARKQMQNQRLVYRKVKHVAVQSNSERCLVLRQRWAMSFLELDLKHKNVINIDETWLGMADWRNFHWKPRD